MTRTAITTPHAPSPLGKYSQAILSEGRRTLFISGQLPLEPRSGLPIVGDITNQTEQVLDNLAAVLAAASMTFDNLVRVGIYLANADDFAAVNDLYGRRFHQAFPARTTVVVARFRMQILIEMDAIAVT